MLMRVPDLPHRDYSHAPRTCSPSLKIELTSTWSHQSKLSMTSRCRRSWNRFWRKSTEEKGKRVKSDLCRQRDSCLRQEDIYCNPIFKTFKEIWRKSWSRRRGLGSQWLVLLVTFLYDWYFFMFVTQLANSYMHSWLFDVNYVEC